MNYSLKDKDELWFEIEKRWRVFTIGIVKI